MKDQTQLAYELERFTYICEYEFFMNGCFSKICIWWFWYNMAVYIRI